MSHLENIRAQNHSLWFSDVLIRLQEVRFPVALLNLRPETKIMEVNSFQTKVFLFLLLATLKCKMSFLWSGQNTRTHAWKGWKEKKNPILSILEKWQWWVFSSIILMLYRVFLFSKTLNYVKKENSSLIFPLLSHHSLNIQMLWKSRFRFTAFQLPVLERHINSTRNR